MITAKVLKYKQTCLNGNSLLILDLNLQDHQHAKPVPYLQFSDKEKRAF